MPSSPDSDALLHVLRRAVVAGVRSDGPDLTLRQLAALMRVYAGEGPATVKEVARDLSVAGPAVTRAYVRLEGLGYLRRRRGDGDRRSAVAGRTTGGTAAVAAIRARLAEAAAGLVARGTGQAPAA